MQLTERELEAWNRAAEIAAKDRAGETLTAEEQDVMDRLWPPALFPPHGLGHAGRMLWFNITSEAAPLYKVGPRALHLLEQACRVADEIALLEEAVERDGATVAGSRGQSVVHPALQEIRQLRLVELRLLRQVDTGDDPEDTPAQRLARHAAKTRWSRKRHTEALKREIRSR